MIPWKSRWRAFLDIVIDPWTITLIVVSAFLVKVIVEQTDRFVVAILTVILSVVSGVLGGLLTNRWTQITGERVTVARGKVAVRSLKLLLGNIAALERRVRTYLERYQDGKRRESLNDEVVTTYLEEIIGRTGVLEEETLSSIENWMDILPEADVRTQIGVISKLREELSERARDLEGLNVKLKEVAGKSEEKEETLKKQIYDKEQEITRLRKELSEKKSVVGPIFPTGVGSVFVSPGPGSLTLGSPLYEQPARKCQICGETIEGGTSLFTGSCPKCGRQLI